MLGGIDLGRQGWKTVLEGGHNGSVDEAKWLGR